VGWLQASASPAPCAQHDLKYQQPQQEQPLTPILKRDVILLAELSIKVLDTNRSWDQGCTECHELLVLDLVVLDGSTELRAEERVKHRVQLLHLWNVHVLRCPDRRHNARNKLLDPRGVTSAISDVNLLVFQDLQVPHEDSAALDVVLIRDNGGSLRKS